MLNYNNRVTFGAMIYKTLEKQIESQKLKSKPTWMWGIESPFFWIDMTHYFNIPVNDRTLETELAKCSCCLIKELRTF